MITHTTVSDLWLFLDDLETEKKPLVVNTSAYRIFGPKLCEMRTVFATLRKGLEKKPLAEELKETDFVHDASEKAIHFLSLVLEPIEVLPESTRAFLVKVRETFAPSLSDLKKSYEDEAALAKRRSTALEAMRGELEAFPIGPISLYTLVTMYLDAGNKLDTLLSTRADTAADDDTKRTKRIFALRSQTLKLIQEFRCALAREVDVDKELSRNLEAEVFSYLDQLSDTRGQRPHPDKSK